MEFRQIDTPMHVRPADLDILGHVNNAVVLEFFEAGRWAWMDAHGVQRNAKVLPVVVRIEIDYRKEIGMQDLIVRTNLHDPPLDLEDADTYRITFQQQVFIDGKTLAAEGFVSVGFIDTETRKLRTLNEFLAAASPTTNPPRN